MSAADVSSLPLSEWPAAVTLRDAGPSRGRGIFAQRSIAAGEAILCEEAVAAAPLPTDAADPWQAAAPLVAAPTATAAWPFPYRAADRCLLRYWPVPYIYTSTCTSRLVQQLPELVPTMTA